MRGDTVNVASRLETSAEPNRIHFSEAVAKESRSDFELEPRRSIDLKGKGEMKTYFLTRSRPPP